MSSPAARHRGGPIDWGDLLRQVNLFAPDAGPMQRFTASGLCALFGLAALACQRSGPWSGFLALAIAAYAFGGLRATLAAGNSLRARHPDINVLMIVAAIVSAALGHWGDGAVLLFLFSLSDALECYALNRTRGSINALIKLRPDTARVVRDDREFTLRVEELRVGDVIRCRPGERFPIDGTVMDGAGAVDESVVTGESLPIDKQPGMPIFAGTINVNGSLLVRMTKAASESTIARIVALVESAQENKAAAQRIIEKWQTPYVVGVFALSAATMLVHLLVHAQPVEAIRTAMILLVAASPCAVVLASPVAVLATVTHGARRGVLFKGGSHIERLATVDTIALDKTGTITFGRPVVTDIVPFDGADAARVLGVAAGLELHSEHPLARAVVAEAARRGLEPLEVREFTSEAGLGVWGRNDAGWIGVGRPELFQRHGLGLSPELGARISAAAGQTAVVVLGSDGLAGVIFLADEIRPEAPGAVMALRDLGIVHVLMLTGDHIGAAERVAHRVGISEVRAGLHPHEKQTEIQRLAKAGGGVAMVGDGVNDAPALAAATVGIAMGGAGSDVALETADVVLMRDDLRTLSEAVSLARRSRLIIQQSLAFAFGMIAVLVVLTLAGGLILPLAVICHEGSTVLVVLNGLRLLRSGSPTLARGDETLANPGVAASQ